MKRKGYIQILATNCRYRRGRVWADMCGSGGAHKGGLRLRESTLLKYRG